MKTGRSWKELADFDLPSFHSLLDSVLRVHAAQKCEDTWTATVSAQGTQENVKDWVRQRWGEILNTDETPQNDLAAFIARVSGGL